MLDFNDEICDSIHPPASTPSLDKLAFWAVERISLMTEDNILGQRSLAVGYAKDWESLEFEVAGNCQPRAQYPERQLPINGSVEQNAVIGRYVL